MADATTTTTAADTSAATTTTGADTTKTAAATTAADTTKTAAATIVGNTDATKTDTTAQTAPADFPADWRVKVAGEDKSFLKTLDRFGSPADLATAYRALQQRVSAGELKAPLAKDADEKAIAAYRKDNKLPETADGYVGALALPNGIVIGEADKPIVSDFVEKVAHKNLWTQEQVNQTMGWYYSMQDALAVKREDDDGAFHKQSDDALRAEWGPEYRSNVNAVDNLVARMPDGLGEALLTARFPMPTKEDPARTVKGGDHPALIKFLSQLEREVNPMATLVPAGSGDSAKTLAEEKVQIEKLMGDKASAYWKGPDAEKMQQRYRDIITAEERLKARAA